MERPWESLGELGEAGELQAPAGGGRGSGRPLAWLGEPWLESGLGSRRTRRARGGRAVHPASGEIVPERSDGKTALVGRNADGEI